MTTETLTVEQDFTTLDLLLWRRFKVETPGQLEETYELNQGLAELGMFLPVGTRVLVNVPNPTTAPVVRRVTRLF